MAKSLCCRATPNLIELSLVRVPFAHPRIKNSQHAKEKPDLPVIGWREWVGLPDLNIDKVKVKVDSGARSSSLHAFDVEEFQRDGDIWVRFSVHPAQRTVEGEIEAECKILEKRAVRSSSGKTTLRPVIVTNVQLLGITWPVELTLANRDEMGFRMLLGREAFRGRFLVDGGSSYYGGKPKRKRIRPPADLNGS